MELNPNAIGTRYQKAQILFQQKKYEESLAELKKVLAINSVHDDALRLAGYISATLDHNDEALDYYSRYLELNPGSADVRMKIAYDLANAGDPAGAMQLIQAGLDVDPENVDLLEQFGGFAFSAALNVSQKANMGAENGGGVAPEAQEYFRKAIAAYEKVYAKKGEDTPVSDLKNIIAAYVQLDDLDQAIATAEKALKTHPQEDAIWSYYADALQRAGQARPGPGGAGPGQGDQPRVPQRGTEAGKLAHPGRAHRRCGGCIRRRRPRTIRSRRRRRRS